MADERLIRVGKHLWLVGFAAIVAAVACGQTGQDRAQANAGAGFGGGSGSVGKGGTSASGAGNEVGSGADGGAGGVMMGGAAGDDGPLGGAAGESGATVGDAGHAGSTGGEPGSGECTDNETRPCGQCNAGTQQCSNGFWGECSDVLALESARGPNMLCVPAGTFNMGSADPELPDDSRPVHPVTLRSFWMDETEVTAAQFVACYDDGGCSEPILGYSCTFGDPLYENHPINCVHWGDSNAFCQWAGKRLPKEEEWEYAARGTDGRIYAWGNAAPTDELAHWHNTVDDYPRVVASYPAGRSPFGLYDMTGNVREWTAGNYCPYPNEGPILPCETVEHFVRRGGDGFGVGDVTGLHAARRTYEHHTSFAAYAGFRCVKDIAP